VTKRLHAIFACGAVALVWMVAYFCFFGVSPPAQGRTSHEHHAQHGGLVEAIGTSHIELLVEKGGRLRVYTLGKDETQIRPLAVTELTAEVQAHGAAEFNRVNLRAEPLPGDTPGTAAQFAGQLPTELVGKPLNIILTVPIDGNRYRARFMTTAHGAESSHETVMPQTKVIGISEKERNLFLTPGGLYSYADIQANGRQVASEKFRNFEPKHNLFPKPGERICPVTKTVANPACSWIVNGKNYTFCCPPCIEEFVRQGKEKPNTIKTPEEYVKR
jgi:hypothetical protein